MKRLSLEVLVLAGFVSMIPALNGVAESNADGSYSYQYLNDHNVMLNHQQAEEYLDYLIIQYDKDHDLASRIPGETLHLKGPGGQMTQAIVAEPQFVNAYRELQTAGFQPSDGTKLVLLRTPSDPKIAVPVVVFKKGMTSQQLANEVPQLIMSKPNPTLASTDKVVQSLPDEQKRYVTGYRTGVVLRIKKG